MNLLFVCSGNSCRSPMAMATAFHAFQGEHECDSAAGNIKGGKFTSSKSVSSKAVTAIEKLYGDKGLKNYKPKSINSSLVIWADYIIVLGEKFGNNIRKVFPKDAGKVILYCEYKSKNGGKITKDVPDPFDGDHWSDCFETTWPGKSQESYDLVAAEMMEVFQPVLEALLGGGKKPSQPKLVEGMKPSETTLTDAKVVADAKRPG
ncbi:MAG: protein-tyrosine-phosphatase [Pseudohongiellaceae bacterium]|jgi:protein-tyrosine-phosphatase